MAERFAADADSWFELTEIEPGIWLVAEPGHVFSWLICGSERSVLLDTGLGLADIASVVEPLSPSPVTVVSSHTHFDHIGGNALFDRVAMHELGPEWLARNCDPALLTSYSEAAVEMTASFERLLAADREGWFVLGPDQAVRPWPTAEIAANGWRVEPLPPTQLLTEGELLDLGDRELRVIHTPGHAADHICLLDERAGILWAQDQAYYGPQLLYLDGSDPAAFALSARRLADELAPSLRAVFTAHCLRPSVPPGFLTQLADGAESVLSGEARLSATIEPFGAEVLGADFGHFSVLVPRGFDP